MSLIKAAVAAVAGTLGTLAASTGVSFSNTITLGAAIIAAVVAVATLVGVIYGAKNRTLARLLEQERDAEHARGDRLERDLQEAKDALDEQRAKHEAYRDEKHRVVSDLHAQVKRSQAELAMERQKHDYSGLVAQVAALNRDLSTRTPLFEQIIQNQQETTAALGRIVEALDVLLARPA